MNIDCDVKIWYMNIINAQTNVKLYALNSSVSDFDSNGCYVLLTLVALGCHVNLYKPLSYEEMTTSIL